MPPLVGNELLLTVVLGHLGAALFALGLGLYVARTHRERPIGRVFVLLLGSLTIWILGGLLRLFSPSPDWYVLLTTVKYVGITTAPVLFLLFALVYAGKRDLLTRRFVALAFVVPAVTLLTVATTRVHGLFYDEFLRAEFASTTVFVTTHGPAFWLWVAFGWGAIVVSTGILIYAAAERSGIFRTQLVLILLALTAAWGSNVAHVVWGWPHRVLDPVPFGFAVSALFLAISVFSTRFMDVVPTARSLVFDTIDDAVVVLDSSGRVVDANEAAHPLLSAARPIGMAAADVLPDPLVGAPADAETITLNVKGDQRHYRHRRLPIGPEGTQGSVVVLTDLSEQVAATRELERQNDRLEDFASVVSHDLRNPLNVAQGHRTLAAEECPDSEHLEQVERAHTRMEHLIEDLLVLAREGTASRDPGVVDLASLVEACWRTVDTADATLHVETDRSVVADPTRLRQVLENLVRNSIEHAGENVTVTVSDIEDGFAVEDDGPGIPADERETVFERGYTTAEAGTGFGLAIVQRIAEGEGWTVHATESDTGGARIEIRGVDVVE